MQSCKKNCNYKVEMLLNNYVDNDVRSFLLPLSIMQTICLCPKYRIKDNYVYTTSRSSNIILFFGTIVFISMYFMRMILFIFDEYTRNHTTFKLVIFIYDFCFYCTGFCLNFFLSIILVEKNVNFILTIQSVHRFINNKKYLQNLTLGNWIFVLFVFSVYIFDTTIFIFNFSLVPKHNILARLILICFDAHIVYVIRSITWLKDLLNLWTKEMLDRRLYSDMDEKQHYIKMFQCYTDILGCFNNLKSSFKHIVSNIIKLNQY